MATIRCPQCGQAVDEWARACPVCGYDLIAAPPVEGRAPGEGSRPSDIPEAEETRALTPEERGDDPRPAGGRRGLRYRKDEPDGPATGALGEAREPREPRERQQPREPQERGLPSVACPACGKVNRGSRAQCERCGEPLRPAAARTMEQQRRPASRPVVPTPLLALIALAVIAAVVYFLVFARDGDEGGTPTEAAVPSEAAEDGTAPEQAPAEPAAQTYVVAEGDSLSSIAQQFGVTVEALAAENGITDPNVIALGQELVIPDAAPPPASPPPSPAPT